MGTDRELFIYEWALGKTFLCDHDRKLLKLFQFYHDENCVYTGSQIAFFPSIASQSICQLTCSITEGCQYFLFDFDVKDCQLFNSTEKACEISVGPGIVLYCFKCISRYTDRVQYCSYLAKSTFKSHTTNVATFIVPRHPVTILVTDFTKSLQFD